MESVDDVKEGVDQMVTKIKRNKSLWWVRLLHSYSKAKKKERGERTTINAVLCVCVCVSVI